MSRPALYLGLFSALLAVGCLEAGDAGSTGDEGSARERPSRGPATGIGFRLSDADAAIEALEEREAVAGVPLGKAEAARLLRRLPELVEERGDAQEFALPARSIPAPRPGTTVEEAFPPKEGPPPVEPAPTGPLRVERYAPEGEVPLVPKVSLTFSEPMVPIASLEALSGETIPARISPEVEGAWNWLGTQTLVFQPAERFPMATAFSVIVPAGAKAMSGQTLENELRWSFSTPRPSLVRRLPLGDSVGREPVIFAAFNQTIDPETIFASLELRAGGKKVPVRLVPREEAEEDDGVRRAIERAGEGRWFAFRPTRPLPEATYVEARIAKGARGAEGPLPITEDQVFGFKTFGPIELKEVQCGWFDHCTPLTPIRLMFSSQLDASRFDPKLVTVSPEIPDLKIEVVRNILELRGRTKGSTDYMVTVAPGLTDVHGQKLGKPARAKVPVGSARPRLFLEEREMVVLDPAGPPEYVVYSINESALHAQVYAVAPEEWPVFEAWHRIRRRYGGGTPPGRLVLDEILHPNETPDELAATKIDLSAALEEGLGHAVVHVVAAQESHPNERPPELMVWVQSTRLGLHTYLENDRATAWVTRLEDGAPLDEVEVSLVGASDKALTKDGMATLPRTGGRRILVAKHGEDTTFVAQGEGVAGATIGRARETMQRWFVFDDRGIYQPGEEVHIKGWVRLSELWRGGDLSHTPPDLLGEQIEYVVRGSRGSDVAKGSVAVSDTGSFDFAIKLPEGVNLGRAIVRLSLKSPLDYGRPHVHFFSIEEFRKPEYEVVAQLSEGPYLAGEEAVATVNASYYAGGGLPAAPVDWTVKKTSTSFTPPNQSGFHFGPVPTRSWFSLWWFFHGSRDDEEEEEKETWSAQTDAGGSHRLRLSFDEVEPAYPFSLALTASVEDLNRQRWAGRASMLVHPSDRYVGLRLAKNFVRAGEPIDVDLVVADLEGKLVGDRPIEVRAARIHRTGWGRDHVEEEVGVQRCEVKSRAGASPVRCTFSTTEGGSYRLTAVVTDEQGRKNQSTIEAWVLGGVRPSERGLDEEKVLVVPDKDEYTPGETATILVIAPFAPAEGVLTLRRQGVVHLERFSMEETSKTLELSLDDSLVPNVEIAVDLVGAAPREGEAEAPKRPAYASGAADMKILPSTRTLEVRAMPKAAYLPPGGSTTIEVEVRDPKGRPAKDAEVAVVVVDEAVLALSRYRTPDPLAYFYEARPSDVRALESRTNIVLANAKKGPEEPDDSAEKSGDAHGVAGLGSRGLGLGGIGTRGGDSSAGLLGGLGNSGSDIFGGGGLGAGINNALGGLRSGRRIEEEDETPIFGREDFAPLALFAPRVRTNAKGRASVPVKLPDNLTRYRVMAVAAAGENHFGSSEATITARLPLMVRPSAPRFLHLGDTFELSVQLQNHTDAPVEASVVARATNAEIQDAARRVRVPPNDRVEVRFPSATLRAGTARFQFGVAAPGFADASQIEVPVYTPGSSEAFATYGVLDEGAIAQTVQLPEAVFTQFGGLEVSMNSTQLQALTDAVIYLANYPFDCSEQLASRVVTIAALRDVLSAFRAEGLPPAEELQAAVEEDLERLARIQHANGGWSFWEGQTETRPYVSVHVAHALVRAREKGFAPSAEAIGRAMDYLRKIDVFIPGWYRESAQRSIQAYALHVRWRNGDGDAPKDALRLIELSGGVEKLPLEAIGWLWPILSNAEPGLDLRDEVLAEIRRHVENRVSETASTAELASGYGDLDWVLLHSSRRTDAVLLEALIHDRPESTLIPKLVKGLLGHRKAGRWRNTQENAFVLLALDRYFAVYEGTSPDFVARLWLGDRFAGEHAFRGRTTETHELRMPMSWLEANAASAEPLVLGKEGPGRLYYRIGMQYMPRDLKLPPLDRGFTVTRTYEGADRADDVWRDEDGTWRIRLGARVRVRVSLVAPERRYHVALVDPLPAGFEPLNPALAVTGELPKDPNAAQDAVQGMGFWRWLWSRTWYEHQNLRDQRAEAFASLLYPGVWDYSYLATATTPGVFIAPPTKAEEMYAPEVFGRGAQERVIVE